MVWAVRLVLCFHFAVAGVPHLLSYPRLVRLRSRNAVIDC